MYSTHYDQLDNINATEAWSMVRIAVSNMFRCLDENLAPVELGGRKQNSVLVRVSIYLFSQKKLKTKDETSLK